MAKGYSQFGAKNSFWGKRHTEQSKELNRLKHIGKIPWNKGKKGYHIHSESYKQTLHLLMLGSGNNFFGKHHTTQSKEQIRLKHIGKPATLKQLSSLKLGAAYWKGKSLVRPAWNKGLKGYRSGSLNNRWKGGITSENRRNRTSIEYKEWRKKVSERDDYRCFGCGQRGGWLEIHHIYSFSEYPRLRYEVENGITFCNPCHAQQDKYRGVISTIPVSTPVQIVYTKQ